MACRLPSHPQSPNLPPAWRRSRTTRNPTNSSGPATAPTRNPLRLAAGPEYCSRTSAQAAAAPPISPMPRGGRCSATPGGCGRPGPPPPQFGAVPYARTVVGGGMACGAAEGTPAGGVEEEYSQPGDSRRGNTRRPQPGVPTGPGAELWASARTVAARRVAGVHENRMIRRYDSPIESRHSKPRITGPHADALRREPHANRPMRRRVMRVCQVRGSDDLEYAASDREVELDEIVHPNEQIGASERVARNAGADCAPRQWGNPVGIR